MLTLLMFQQYICCMYHTRRRKNTGKREKHEQDLPQRLSEDRRCRRHERCDRRRSVRLQCRLGSTSTAASGSAAASGATGTYIPGTYEGTAEGISSTVKVTMTFSDSAVTDVVVDTSGETASYGAAAADELREQLMAAGSAEIDGVSGSTVTSNAVMKAAKSCYAQAKGEAVVSQRAAAHRRRERLAGHRARHRRGRHHRDMGYRYRHRGRRQRWYVRSRLCCTERAGFPRDRTEFFRHGDPSLVWHH